MTRLSPPTEIARKTLLLPTVLAALFGFVPAGHAAGDYPTVAVADYVFACMKANGETRKALEACSCSIDVVATIIPYEGYEAAETFKSMGLGGGERGAFFRESADAKLSIANLKRAQAEADVRCF
jgi:hypothetical protein